MVMSTILKTIAIFFFWSILVISKEREYLVPIFLKFFLDFKILENKLSKVNPFRNFKVAFNLLEV